MEWREKMKKLFFWLKKPQEEKVLCLKCGKEFIVKRVFTPEEIKQGGKNEYCPFCKKGIVWIPAPQYLEFISDNSTFDPKIELRI